MSAVALRSASELLGFYCEVCADEFYSEYVWGLYVLASASLRCQCCGGQLG